ncbi:MAG: Sec-independent protein translocase protein TatB [Hyphomicrobiaceae bacterium]
MFDIGWAELMVVGVVALLVVGPKELPALLRTLGRYVGLVRRHANDFRRQFDEAIKETELDQLRKEVDGLRSDATKTWRDVEAAGKVTPDALGKPVTGPGSDSAPEAAAKSEVAVDAAQPPVAQVLPAHLDAGSASPAAMAAAAATARRIEAKQNDKGDHIRSPQASTEVPIVPPSPPANDTGPSGLKPAAKAEA